MSTKKESTNNVKIFFVLLSITAIAGLWMAFASKAQREALASQTQAQPIVSGEIYYPEMPTLVPMVEVNQQMVNIQPEQPVQELRSVSVPTPAIQQSAPQVGIQSIIVGGSSSGGSGGSNTTSSQPAPQTSTKAS